MFIRFLIKILQKIRIYGKFIKKSKGYIYIQKNVTEKEY